MVLGGAEHLSLTNSNNRCNFDVPKHSIVLFISHTHSRNALGNMINSWDDTEKGINGMRGVRSISHTASAATAAGSGGPAAEKVGGIGASRLTTGRQPRKALNAPP